MYSAKSVRSLDLNVTMSILLSAMFFISDDLSGFFKSSFFSIHPHEINAVAQIK